MDEERYGNEAKVIQGVCSTLRFAQHSIGAESALRGEWSPPQSPCGGFRGKYLVDHDDFNDLDGKRLLSFFLLPPGNFASQLSLSDWVIISDNIYPFRRFHDVGT